MMTHAQARRPLEFDEEDLIAEDLACAQCGYNLRLTPRDGTCSECGRNVGATIRPDLIQLAAPGFARRLRTGAMFYIVSTSIYAVYVLVMQSIIAVVGYSRVFEWIYFGNDFLVHIILMVGCWLLTTPETGVRSSASALYARWAMLGFLLIEFLSRSVLISVQSQSFGGNFSFPAYMGSQLCWNISTFFLYTATIALWVHLYGMMNRTPYPGIALHLLIGALGLTVAQCFFYLMQGLFMLMTASSYWGDMVMEPETAGTVIGFVAYSALGTGTLGSIWMIVAMWKWRGRLMPIAQRRPVPPQPLSKPLSKPKDSNSPNSSDLANPPDQMS